MQLDHIACNCYCLEVALFHHMNLHISDCFVALPYFSLYVFFHKQLYYIYLTEPADGASCDTRQKYFLHLKQNETARIAFHYTYIVCPCHGGVP